MLFTGILTQTNRYPASM